MKGSRGRMVLGAWLCFGLCRAMVGQQTTTNAPLYLLSYDHGGLILWGPEHFAERLRNAIQWLDRYPGFKIGLDNEAYVYDYLAEHDPTLLKVLRGYLKKYRGRFAIGSCTYGQPLSCFINEESNIRQIQYAIRTGRKLLDCEPRFYLMSEHAMHSQMPQILNGLNFQGALLRTHFMMYGYNPTFDVPTGWWVGLDASRIAAIPTYPDQGAAFGRTTVDNWFLTRYPGPEVKLSPEEFRARFSHINPLLASRVDDSGLRKEDLVKQFADNPDYRWVLAEDILHLFPQPTAEMRTLPNDFTVRMPWGYCANEIWNMNRQAEVSVLTAERMAAVELILGGADRQAELERAWKNLLVGQHHDIQICGLTAEARQFLSASIAASTNAAAESLRFIAAKMKGDGLQQVTVFNPLSWTRSDWVEADFHLPRVEAKFLTVLHQGHAVPAALLQADRRSDSNLLSGRLAFLGEVPPLSFASFSIRPSALPPAIAPEEIKVNRAGLSVATPNLQIQLDPHGGIESLIDRHSGKPLLRPGRRSLFLAGRIDGVDCESHGRWTLHSEGDQRFWVIAREDGFISDIPFTLEMRIRPDQQRLDCKLSIHLEAQKIGQLSDDPRDGKSPFAHERKLRIKLFPAVGEGATAVRDLPFAIAETTDRYVEGIYWTAVSDTNGGVAFLNKGTMGSVREDDGGFSMPLAYSMYYIWGTRILSGRYSYEFSVLPFSGSRSADGLHRAALAYNFPLVSQSGAPADGTLGEVAKPIWIDETDGPIVTAVYPEGGRVLLRAFQNGPEPGRAQIRLKGGLTRLVETDLLGEGKLAVENPASFRPWQFRTFRLEESR